MFPPRTRRREPGVICSLIGPRRGGRKRAAITLLVFFVLLHLTGLVIWLVHDKPIRADNYQCLQSGLPYRVSAVRFPSDWLQYSSLKPNQQSERTKWRKWDNGAAGGGALLRVPHTQLQGPGWPAGAAASQRVIFTLVPFVDVFFDISSWNDEQVTTSTQNV